MSVGGALTAILMWLNDVHEKLVKGDDRGQLAAIVVRGEMERSSATRGFHVAKIAYVFLKDNMSPTFGFPSWNRGRLVCQRPQLKRLSLTTSEQSPDGSPKDLLVSIIDWSFPQLGSRIYRSEFEGERAAVK